MSDRADPGGAPGGSHDPASGAGSLIVVSAPSGAGKTTLCRRLLAELPSIEFSVSHTTRPRRHDEREGVDYHFVDRDTFLRARDRGEFLEWAQVGDHLYGTAADPVRRVLAHGRDVLLDVDTQGAVSIHRLEPGAILVFILPPGPDALRQRLEARGSETPESLARRLELARGEIEKASLYEYLVVNDDLEAAYDRLRAVVLSARCRRLRQEARLRDIAGRFGPGGR